MNVYFIVICSKYLLESIYCENVFSMGWFFLKSHFRIINVTRMEMRNIIFKLLGNYPYSYQEIKSLIVID